MDTTPKTTPTEYTPEQREIIDGLSKCQQTLGLSNKQFTAKYLQSYTESTWSRLLSATYGAKNLDKTFAELRSALISIRRRIQRQQKATQGGKYYELEQFAALFESVKECLEKKGENRLTIYVAPTGAGKSRFFAELGAREETILVRGNEAWRTSYYYAAIDILRELEVTGRFASAAEARQQVIAGMSGRVKTLCIDEGNYFGPLSINFLKDILNETEWAVVLGMTPAFWARMRRYFSEFVQLQRRIHKVFVFKGVTAADAREFLVDAGLNGDSDKAAIALSKAANAFGGYDLINRVIERLGERDGAGAHPSLGDVEAAIHYVRTTLGLE